MERERVCVCACVCAAICLYIYIYIFLSVIYKQIYWCGWYIQFMKELTFFGQILPWKVAAHSWKKRLILVSTWIPFVFNPMYSFLKLLFIFLIFFFFNCWKALLVAWDLMDRIFVKDLFIYLFIFCCCDDVFILSVWLIFTVCCCYLYFVINTFPLRLIVVSF